MRRYQLRTSNFLRHYTNLEGQNPDLLNDAGNCWMRRGEVARAISYYTAAASSMDKLHHYIHYTASYLHLLLAVELRKMGDHEAQHHYDRALFQDHGNYDAQNASMEVTYDKHLPLEFDLHSVPLRSCPRKAILYEAYYGGYFKECRHMLQEMDVQDSLLEVALGIRTGGAVAYVPPLLRLDYVAVLLGEGRQEKASRELEGIMARGYQWHYLRHKLVEDWEVRVWHLRQAVGLHEAFHRRYHAHAAIIYSNLAHAYISVDPSLAMNCAYKALDLDGGCIPGMYMLLESLVTQGCIGTAAIFFDNTRHNYTRRFIQEMEEVLRRGAW